MAQRMVIARERQRSAISDHRLHRESEKQDEKSSGEQPRKVNSQERNSTLSRGAGNELIFRTKQDKQRNFSKNSCFLTDFWPKICICQKKVVSLRPELCVCMYEARVHTWGTKNKNSRLLIGTTNKANRQQKGQTKPTGMTCRRNRQNSTQLTGLINKHEQNN